MFTARFNNLKMKPEQLYSYAVLYLTHKAGGLLKIVFQLSSVDFVDHTAQWVECCSSMVYAVWENICRGDIGIIHTSYYIFLKYINMFLIFLIFLCILTTL